MGSGFLSVYAYTANEALPVSGARVVVTSPGGQALYDTETDASGSAGQVAIEAPDKFHDMDPGDPGPYYSNVDVEVSAPGYNTQLVRGVHIYDTVTFILPVDLVPMTATQRSAYINEVVVPQPAVEQPAPRMQAGPVEPSLAESRVLKNVVIPNNIRVHLGAPSAYAQNVTIPFKTYIKNVSTHEIYNNWLPSALEANILAEITFALNRVYSEWYPSRGYDFDITNNTQYDQCYVYGDGFAANIGEIVDRIFNQYVRRIGHKEPFFTRYCNGTTSTCPGGMSQFGSQELAQQGLNALQILRSYYPTDVEVAETNNISDNISSYPGYALSMGSSGESVIMLQQYLNRIRTNFPNIPLIPSVDGVFGQSTANAVKAFQQQFGLTADGVVGKGTWYEVSRVYGAVIKLGELDGEGQFIGLSPTPPTVTISQGSTGTYVAQLQFLLNYISAYNSAVPSVLQTSSFDAQTKASVMAFQSAYGLNPDGVVGPSTWSMLYNVYKGAQGPATPPPSIPSYPGYLISQGSNGSYVLNIQQALNKVAAVYPQIPRVSEDGAFGPGTRASVVKFQQLFGLTADGVVGQSTWNALMSAAAQAGPSAPTTPSVPAYPGYLISQGSTGSYVTQIQNAINAVSTINSSVPRVTADGVFGAGTANAVKAYQRYYGLTADGIVGQSTWNNLMQRAASVSGYQAPYQQNQAVGQFNQNMQNPVQCVGYGQPEVYYNQGQGQWNQPVDACQQYNQPVNVCQQYNAAQPAEMCGGGLVKPLVAAVVVSSFIKAACGC